MFYIIEASEKSGIFFSIYLIAWTLFLKDISFRAFYFFGYVLCWRFLSFYPSSKSISLTFLMRDLKFLCYWMEDRLCLMPLGISPKLMLSFWGEVLRLGKMPPLGEKISLNVIICSFINKFTILWYKWPPYIMFNRLTEYGKLKFAALHDFIWYHFVLPLRDPSRLYLEMAEKQHPHHESAGYSHLQWNLVIGLWNG